MWYQKRKKKHEELNMVLENIEWSELRELSHLIIVWCNLLHVFNYFDHSFSGRNEEKRSIFIVLIEQLKFRIVNMLCCVYFLSHSNKPEDKLHGKSMKEYKKKNMWKMTIIFLLLRIPFSSLIWIFNLFDRWICCSFFCLMGFYFFFFLFMFSTNWLIHRHFIQ